MKPIGQFACWVSIYAHVAAWEKMATGVPVNELFERVAQTVSYISEVESICC